MNRQGLALEAIRTALSVRQQLKIAPTAAISVFDIAQRLKIEVRLVEIPTLEGMYVAGRPPRILLSSLRPAGRQAMTCAHEIGHHVYGHGSIIDEYVKAESSPVTSDEEYIANTFAANLLMTKPAVARALLARGISASDPRPEQIYVMANWLGVGYTALIHHMRSALHFMNRDVADTLLKVRPKVIRAAILSRESTLSNGNLIVADHCWTDRPIDIQAGDIVFVPKGAQFNDACCEINGRTLDGRQPGIGRVFHEESGWSAFVRVSRKGYTGLAEYRHLEDPDADDAAAATPEDSHED